jgi:hypothetical protein
VQRTSSVHGKKKFDKLKSKILNRKVAKSSLGGMMGGGDDDDSDDEE